MLQPDWADITVDTVERFQGNQRRVIVVTTVRSNPQDKLGFMSDPKVLNNQSLDLES
jgi:superfamily I DNA and/or RNA helicase